MHLRIKYLRKTLKLSQADFGTRIEVSRDVINNIEQNRNKRPVAEYLISRICRTFNVNEVWIRTGEGDMFSLAPNNLIEDLRVSHDLSQSAASIISNFIKMSKSEQELFIELASKIFYSND